MLLLLIAAAVAGALYYSSKGKTALVLPVKGPTDVSPVVAVASPGPLNGQPFVYEGTLPAGVPEAIQAMLWTCSTESADMCALLAFLFAAEGFSKTALSLSAAAGYFRAQSGHGPYTDFSKSGLRGQLIINQVPAWSFPTQVVWQDTPQSKTPGAPLAMMTGGPLTAPMADKVLTGALTF